MANSFLASNMKRIFTFVLAGFACVHAALATDAVFRNFGLLTNTPAIDARGFDNRGTIDLLAPPPSVGLWSSWYTVFDSQNTMFFTNRGIMVGSLGFRFDNLTPTALGYQHRPASYITNSGSISAVDTPYAGEYDFNVYGVPIGSYFLANATNISNPGSISVGEMGLLSLTGKTVDLSNGSLSAGGNVGLTNEYGILTGYGYRVYGSNYYYNPAGVQDVLAEIRTNQLSLVGLTYGGPDGWSPRWDDPYYPNSYNGTGAYGAWAYLNPVSSSNYYISIVFVRTNDLATNINLDVRFVPGGDTYPYNTNVDNNGIMNIVQIGSVGTDVITGRSATNAYYVLDSGGVEQRYTMLTNVSAGSMSPSCIEIDTDLYGFNRYLPSNSPYDPAMIYPGYEFTVVSNTYASYMAQVGRGGATAQFLNAGTTSSYIYSNPNISLDDITNQGARVEINASTLKLKNTRIRAEGLLTVNAKHLAVGEKVAMDAGVINCDLGSTNGSLCLSNVLPSSFSRVRGSIYCWSASWTNLMVTAAQTNLFNVHVLIVDPTVSAGAPPDIRALALHATNMAIYDPLNVSQSALFDTRKLAVAGPVSLSGDAGSFTATTSPKLSSMLVDTNGSLRVANEVSLGINLPNGLTTFTNRGLIIASELNLKSAVIEHSGTIYSTNSMFIQAVSSTAGNPNAGTLLLTTNLVPSMDVIPGTQVTNPVPVPSRLFSSWDIDISARVMDVNYCNITNGVASSGVLRLDVSDLLTDRVPAVPGTNNVVKNGWQVRNGFELVRKPAHGDLFGTTIRSIADNFQTVNHTWAASDRGRTLAGFADNNVIGHLILERRSAGSTMRFFPASAHSAMYVDRLDLEGYAYTNYSQGLYIDPSLVIYFADSNVDPTKLTNSYPGRLVWVPEFVGPNSAATTRAHIDGVLTNIFANRSLVQNTQLDSNGDGVPNAWDSYPFDGTFVRCTTSTGGTVSPAFDGQSLVIGTNYSVTAVPSLGYSFSCWVITNSTGVITNSSMSMTFPMELNLAMQAQFVPDPAYLKLSVNGAGRVTPDLTSRALRFGQTYQLTATPTSGNAFTGWKGDITSLSRTITFVMRPNLTIEADFVTNQLTGLKGAYTGLFFGVDSGVTNVAFENSGSINFSVTEMGAASGKLIMAGGVYPFSGKFDFDGTSQITVKRPASLGNLSLTVAITADTNCTAIGTVSDNGTFVSELHGYRTGLKAAATAGYYTFAMPGNASGPAGDVYGTMRVSQSGAASFSARLPDGTSFIQSGWMSADGHFPLFFVRSGRDLMLSMVTFDPNNGSVSTMLNDPFIGFSGKVYWLKSAGSSAPYYKDGFSAQMDLNGSRYKTPPAGSSGLFLNTPIMLQLSGGLASDTIKEVTRSGSLSYVGASKSAALTIDRATGLFSGNVVNSTGKSTLIRGVVLQRQNLARGFFFESSQSGEVLLHNLNEF